MKYQLRFTPEAKADLEELHAFLVEREPRAARRAIETLRRAWELLERFPFSCRRAEGSPPRPTLREMVISFGKAGYVALFTIEEGVVTVVAVRHQREDDFH